MSTIDRLRELGQSVWLDFLDRELLTSGELDRKVQEGLRGLTSNPTIFQKAIASGRAYDDVIGGAAASEMESTVLERLMVRDIAAACDRLRPVYDRTGGADGFASIEVSPLAAGDTKRSIAEAHRLWEAVSRPNVMVKIPGTPQGVPAIRRCLTDGLNINITLLFSVARYREVVDAYLSALEARLEGGNSIEGIASVASFFVSRVDTKVDKALDALEGARAASGVALRGQIAVANAKIAYEEYARVISSDRWRALAAKGARPQRLLWASTSPKDPRYPDTYYAEALVGADTVDTMTLETLAAYLDHGRPEARLTTDGARAHDQLAQLGELGLDLSAIERELEDEGVRSFSDSYLKAIEAIAARRRQLAGAAGPHAARA